MARGGAARGGARPASAPGHQGCRRSARPVRSPQLGFRPGSPPGPTSAERPVSAASRPGLPRRWGARTDEIEVAGGRRRGDTGRQFETDAAGRPPRHRRLVQRQRGPSAAPAARARRGPVAGRRRRCFRRHRSRRRRGPPPSRSAQICALRARRPRPAPSVRRPAGPPPMGRRAARPAPRLAHRPAAGSPLADSRSRSCGRGAACYGSGSIARQAGHGPRARRDGWSRPRRSRAGWTDRAGRGGPARRRRRWPR